MSVSIDLTAVIRWVRIKLGITPSPDGDALYGRFYLFGDGTHATRMPNGTDWIAARNTHTHSSELPSLTGNSQKYLRVNVGETAVYWDTSGGGVTDHGGLTGLLDDDHPQYHNDARGDARYYTQSQINTTLNNYYTKTQLQTSGQALTHWDNITNEPNFSLVGHTHTAADITDFDTEVSNNTTVTGLVANSHVPVTVVSGTGITVGLAGQQVTVTLNNTAVAAGTYTHATITVNAQGQLTSAATGYIERDIVTVTGNKVLALSDRATLQKCDSASPITITIPLNASVPFPIGTEIDFFRYGAGTVGFSSSAQIRTPGGLSIAAQYRAVHLKKIGTDEWYLLAGA